LRRRSITAWGLSVLVREGFRAFIFTSWSTIAKMTALLDRILTAHGKAIIFD
jgi:hypothetical protein